jgi:SPOR domain
MSATSEEHQATTPAPTEAPPQAGACARCGAPLHPGQEWCLECGAAARTKVVGGANWKVPVLVVATIVLLAGAALAYAWISVSDDAGRSAEKLARTNPAPTASTPTVPAPATATTPAGTATTAPGATATTPSTTTPGVVSPPGDGTTTTSTTSTTPAAPADTAPKPVGSWPAGRTAYTAILLSTSSRAGADKAAKRLAGQGKDVGILDSSDYPSLEGGFWVVFSGQYDDVGAAQQAAKGLGADAPGAYARLVSPR